MGEWLIKDLSIVRVSEVIYKHNSKKQMDFLVYLLKKNVITNKQFKQGNFYLNQNKTDFSHSMLQVTEQNDITNEIRISYHAITKSEKEVKIVPSLVEIYYGGQLQMYPVIKISDNLFITSHSLVNYTKMEALKFDEEKGYYVDIVNNKDFSNLTLENISKMFQIIKNYKASNIVNKIDTENAKSIIEEAAAIKYLEEFQKGTFDKKTYIEIQKEMDTLDIKITAIEREIREELEFAKIKPKDEL